MNPIRIILFISLLLISFLCFSQQIEGLYHDIVSKRTVQPKEKITVDTAQLEVFYHYEMLGNRLSEEITDEMILLIGNEYTNFFSFLNYTTDSLRKANPDKYRRTTTLVLLSNPSFSPSDYILLPYNIFNRGRYLIHQTSGNLICIDADIHIMRNSPQYDYCYEEILEIPLWSISADIETIVGHRSQKATTRYGGRDWTVWFTHEIPISEGPWKLRGLPGLILKAETADGEFSFSATSINRSTSRLIQKYTPNSCQSVTKHELFRIKKAIAEDPYPILRHEPKGSDDPVKFTADYNSIEILE